MNPTKEERERQTKINHDLAGMLHNNGDTRFYGWAIVSLFYAALHAIEMIIDERHITPAVTHTDRRSIIRNSANLRPCYKSYDSLYQSSKVYRYDCQIARVEDVRLAYDDYTSIMQVLRAI